MWVSVNCECGWASSQFSQGGARVSAYEEWRRHVLAHKNFNEVARLEYSPNLVREG